MYDSNFSFWGQRSYVHGSHMIYELEKACEFWEIGKIQKLSASFKIPLEFQGRYHLFRDQIEYRNRVKDFCATFKFSANDIEYYSGIEAIMHSKVEKKIPDNEDVIVSGYKIDKINNKAILSEYPNPLLINAVIALNKKLVNKNSYNNKKKSWFMARIDLNLSECRDSEKVPIELQLIGIIGNKMALTKVYIGKKNVGDLYFNIQGQ